MHKKRLPSTCKSHTNGLGRIRAHFTTLLRSRYWWLIPVLTIAIVSGAQDFERDLRGAEAGEATAMTAVAKRYEQGDGCPRDAGQAILWFKRAAALNEPGAMVALGHIYDEGKCVDQNMREAVRWFRRAVELGSADAMYRLGYMVEHGRGVRADREEAKAWYEKAASQGVARAMTALGDLTGDAQWYRKAVEAGDPPAFAKLAQAISGDERIDLIRRGAAAGDPAAIYEQALLEKDLQRSKALFLKAAEAGYPAAMSRYAALVTDIPGESEVWYQKAADADDPAGLTWAGKRMEKKSAKAAHQMYERAAAKGYLPAITALGVLRADCALMKKAAAGGDAQGAFEYASRCAPEDANDWYRKAGDLGHAEALARLGETKRAAEVGHLKSMLQLGRTDSSWIRKAADAGEPEAMRLYAASLSDPGDAARWYKKSAEAGDVPAMTEIAKRYENGIGVAKDRDLAIRWYRSAAEKSDGTAMYRLALLTSDAAWLKKAADANIPEALCKLGEAEQNRDQALKLFEKAGNAGCTNAWTRIGVLTNDTTMLERAAQAGDPEAKMRLGDLQLQRGKRREAYQLFRAAADAGYSPAMIRVGDCFMNGDGASRSEVDAVNWYRKAALTGDPQALAKLKELGKTQ